MTLAIGRGLLTTAIALIAITSVRSISVFANEGPVLIDSFGTWTLDDLGFGEVAVPADQQVARVSVEYQLPSDAAQGPENWYIIHLHTQVEVAADSRDGLAIISVLHNGWASAQIQVISKRVGDSLSVT